jgi:hypothetical protein
MLRSSRGFLAIYTKVQRTDCYISGKYEGGVFKNEEFARARDTLAALYLMAA